MANGTNDRCTTKRTSSLPSNQPYISHHTDAQRGLTKDLLPQNTGGTSPFTLDDPLPFLDALLGSWACRGMPMRRRGPLKVVERLMDDL
jgi:hypothetical protein